MSSGGHSLRSYDIVTILNMIYIFIVMMTDWLAGVSEMTYLFEEASFLFAAD